MTSVVQTLTQEQRHGTAHVCKSTLNRILKFTHNKEVEFNQVTPAWLIAFQQSLSADNLTDNSISTYMRSLQAVYNRAVMQGLAPFVPYLFRHVHTAISRGESRALAEEPLQQLSATPPQPLPQNTERARMLFVLLYMLRGLSFSDLVHLRRANLSGNQLRLYRHKTKTPLTITVEREAMVILQRYADPNPESVYLFPFITQVGQHEYRQYQTALREFNKELKAVSKALGLNKQVKLSSHCARHSWLTIANYRKFDKKMISNSVGHSSIKMTETYFKDFEELQLRKMSRKMISYISAR